MKLVLKNKAAINPKNNGDKYFQYAVTVALNREQIKSYPEILSNIKPFIDQYDWEKLIFYQIKKTGLSLKK